MVSACDVWRALACYDVLCWVAGALTSVWLQNGATGASASVKEAEAWIAQWQSKQKVASKTRA